MTIHTPRRLSRLKQAMCHPPLTIDETQEIRIKLALAQEDLAHLLGASRQRVNQELKGLEREVAVQCKS